MNQFDAGQAIRFGWQTTKQHFLFFLGIIGILFGLTLVASLLQQLAAPLALAAMLISLAAWVVQIIFQMGVITITLALVDGATPKTSDLWGTIKPFWQYLGGSILFGLIVFIGLVIFIIPGIIFGLALQFFTYLIIDKHMGIFEAFKRSVEITKGVRLKLFGFIIGLWLLNVVGVLLLGIGLLVTIPIAVVAIAHVFRQLDGAAPVSTQAQPIAQAPQPTPTAPTL